MMNNFPISTLMDSCKCRDSAATSKALFLGGFKNVLLLLLITSTTY